MQRVEIVRIPGRLSQFGVDELYYDIEPSNWQERARRLQHRRWDHVRAAMRGQRRLEEYRRGYTHEDSAQIFS